MRRADIALCSVILLCCAVAGLAADRWRNARVALTTRSVASLRPSAAPPDLGRLAGLARERGLLIERVAAAPGGAADLAVSGAEPAVRAYAAALESRRPALRLTRWTLSAVDGDAVRLVAQAVPAAIPLRVAAGSGRALFGTAATRPTPTDAPALAGIVGRLPDDAVALVRGPDGRAVTVARGAEAPGGWRLEALSADAAIFARGAERARVPLLAE